MKKILLFITLFIALSFAAINFIALPKAKNGIKNYFINAGFKNTEIEGVKFSIDGLSIKATTLDKDKFNTAKNIKAKLFWPSYIFNSNIKSITIETLKIASVINNPKDIIAYKQFFNAENINNIATKNIKIENIIWDIATPNNALRLNGSLDIKKNSDVKDITATLNAAQHELSLNSTWSGSIKDNGSFNVEGLYDNLNIATDILKLNRGAGWITLSKQSETNDIAAQLDAGSGALLGIPIKNISLIVNQDNGAYPILLRANAAGIDGVKLYGDLTLSDDIKKQAFELLLDIKSPKQFVSYLNQQNILKNNHLAQKTKTNIYLTYEPENRFAGGPFPFSLKVNEHNKETLKGTFLVYPDKLDIRGTAQGEKSATSLLQTLFSIDKKHVSDGNIRFDDNLKNLF